MGRVHVPHVLLRLGFLEGVVSSPVEASTLACSTVLSLTVIGDYDLAFPAVWVVQYNSYDACDEVCVCAASFIPLAVDLDENHIIGTNVTLGSLSYHLLTGPVEGLIVVRHQVDEAVHSVVGAVCSRYGVDNRSFLER